MLDPTYTQLPEYFYTRQAPQKVPMPRLVVLQEPLAGELGISVDFLKSDYGIAILAGNKLFPGTQPLSQAYAGHQFGYFTMLGDGRAVLLGERVSQDGKRFDIQLKGSGRTPYSRGGDGKALLGPMLREYIVSEGMYGMGIPTTRSLAVLTTGEKVMREGWQDGAVLVRVAASHIRVGTFEYASRFHSAEAVGALADYTIGRHFPEAADTPNPYETFLKQAAQKQAELIASWQLAGFVHGVMNTDNMAVSGETIDYGPCAFLDEYHPETVFSSIDGEGRYAYGNQPNIGAWNLLRLGETLLPLLHFSPDRAVEIVREAIDLYTLYYRMAWMEGFGRKTGIVQTGEQESGLMEELLSIMDQYSLDYTGTFRMLTDHLELEKPVTETLKPWTDKWKECLERKYLTKEKIIEMMNLNNPVVIPRNYWVEKALDEGCRGDLRVLKQLVEALKNPFDLRLRNSPFAQIPQRGSCYRTFCGT